MLTFELKYCTVYYDPALPDLKRMHTQFYDGTKYGAFPHDTQHYHIIAARCGYSDDTWRYCFEHDWVHSFLAEKLCDAPSHSLWALAHNDVPSNVTSVYEEALVQMFQRWMRANERPIIPGLPWSQLKSEALDLLTCL